MITDTKNGNLSTRIIPLLAVSILILLASVYVGNRIAKPMIKKPL